MKNLFGEVKNLLNSNSATIKLFIIRYGVSIDGNELTEKIKNYPSVYRTKRSIKRTGIQNGCLVDKEIRDVPWIPEEIFVAIGDKESVIKVNFRPASPFCLIIENGNLFILSKELNLKIPCRLSPRSMISGEYINGYPADQYVQIIGSDRLGVLGFDGCAEWFYGKQCRFCDSCASRPGEKKARPTLNDLHTKYSDDISSWFDKVKTPYFSGLKKAYGRAHDEKIFDPHCHLLVMAGNLHNLDMEWDYMLDLAEELSEVKPLSGVDSYLNIMPPQKSEYIEKAKKIGFNNLIFNMEVFGDKIFKKVCPGKYDLVPYQAYLEKMIEAVNIFHSGHVRCGFVLGAQPVDELKEGIKFLADQGIVSDYTVFTPKAGTPWQNKLQPDIIEVASFSKFLVSIYEKHDFSPLYCRMSSRSSIMNECFEDSVVKS